MLRQMGVTIGSVSHRRQPFSAQQGRSLASSDSGPELWRKQDR